MKRSIDAWIALRYALKPGMARGVVLATMLPGLALPAWGNEVADERLATEASGQILGALAKPEHGKPDPGLPGIQSEPLPLEPLSQAILGQMSGGEGAEPSPPSVSELNEFGPGESGPGESELDGPGVDESGVDESGVDGAEGTAPNGDPADVAEPIDLPGLPVLAETIAPAPGTAITPAERSEVFVQAAFLQQGDESSARLRGSGIYVLSPSVFAGATVDLTTGQAFRIPMSLG
jgi:hypothetical protein